MAGSSIAGSLSFPFFREPTPGPVNHIATAASLLLSRRISHHIHLTSTLNSFHQNLSSFIHFSSKAKDAWCTRALQFSGLNLLSLSGDGETGDNSNSEGRSHLNASNSDRQNDRKWTNILLAVNILVFISSAASKGKLLQWGAKVNELIDQGQLWRLVTSSFLHGNFGHLLINCYSLNSIGPTVEFLSGSQRFLAVYFASAIASSYMSYWFCKAPSVGASGAIFGLAGSLAVFVVRHRKLTGWGKEVLLPFALTIITNMAIGMMYRRIDNWGHFGGLVGGVATSWLLGPVLEKEPSSLDNGRLVLTDRAPIFYLLNRRRRT